MRRSRRRSTCLAMLFVCGVAGSACAGAPAPATSTTIVQDFVVQPLFVSQPPGETRLLYVVDRAGRIVIVEPGRPPVATLLNIQAQVLDFPSERAMAGLAFHPNFAVNRHFFVTFTNLDGDLEVARFTVSEDPEFADPATKVTLLTIPQIDAIHNGGWLGFGPRGYLHVATGDGGTGSQFSQDLDSMLGKILRLDVDGGVPYGIPAGNPFVGRDGLDEIWAYGVRNPWRGSFDWQTGDFWFADVGRLDREEINVLPATSAGGDNFGWRCTEGTLCAPAPTNCECSTPGQVFPFHEYDHTEGCAVIGGYIYRGAGIRDLAGHYVYADFCRQQVLTIDPATGERSTLIEDTGFTIRSFSEDNGGELYFMGVGRIDKLLPLVNDCNANGIEDEVDIAGGKSLDLNGDGIPDECEVVGDLDSDGDVDAADLAFLLGGWGDCVGCPGDLDGDGDVDAADLAILLGAWGAP